jgi:hypothetical protein
VEHEAPQFSSCSVCGRTILKGERVVEYVTPDGEPAGVCALCRERAEAAGWITAKEAARGGRAPRSRRRGLRERLAGASERATQLAERMRVPAGERNRGDVAATPPTPSRPDATRPRESGGRPPEPRPGPAPAGPERATPRRPSSPRSPQRLMRRALDRFNASEEARKVAGLIRSLGEPHASVKTAPGGDGTVLVTVAWELSWYQWEVGGDPEGGTVIEVAKGTELTELPERERSWNASVAADGKVRIELARVGRAAADEAPAVGRSGSQED